MSNSRRKQRIEQIPITSVHILNPRARSKSQHKEILDNIERVGLKRPITVSRRIRSGGTEYDLVCGEGRLEAFRQLGQVTIPAIVIDAEEADCLLMSLVENVARRKHLPIDLMKEISALSKRGHKDEEIAARIGISRDWVSMILSLLDRGEDRLVAAVEMGLIPMSLAVSIARSDSSEVQNLLMDAYESGKIKGKRLAAIRRMLDRRMRQSKLYYTKLGRRGGSRTVTTAELLRLYQREAEKQRVFVKKSDFAQAKLLFIVEALKELVADDAFRTLLRAEGLATMPKALAERVGLAQER